MLKNFFNKKSEDEKPEPAKNSAQNGDRPKIVIKQRKPSNEPIPNAIANVMSPHSMPKDEYFEPYPEELLEEESESYPSANAFTPAQVETEKSLSQVEVLKFQLQIEELRQEKNQLQERTEVLLNEARSLHATIDKFEKEAAEEKLNLQNSLNNQISNYSALEDEFLRRKEEMDELTENFDHLEHDFNEVNQELNNIKSTSVPKKDYISIQAKLRERDQQKVDLEVQVDMLKKDQIRYESMVTELSTHITELKDSLDKGTDEQFNKLMDVKDQEIVRNGERISELSKQLSDLHAEKKKYQSLLNEKESLVETYQEYESKLIDTEDLVQELTEEIDLLSAEKARLLDEISLLKSDAESVMPKMKAFEAQMDILINEKTELTENLRQLEASIEGLDSELIQVKHELEKEKKKNSLSSEEQDKWKTDLENEISTLQELLTEKESSLSEITTKFDSTLSEVEILVAKLAESNAIILIHESKEKEESSSIDELKQSFETEAANDKVTIQNLTADLEEANEKIASFELDDSAEKARLEISSLKERYNAQLKSEENLLGQIEELERKVNYSVQEKEELNAELVETRKEIDNLKKNTTTQDQIIEMQASLDTMKNDYQALKAKNGVADNKINELLEENTELESKNARLEKEINTLKQVQESAPAEDNSDELAELKNLYKKQSEENSLLQRAKRELESSFSIFNMESPTINPPQETKNQTETTQQETPQSEATKAKPTPSRQAAKPKNSNYLLNLIVKPENEEYELELPGDMNAKEIKAELTEAGLLDPETSYDLFIPRIDVYLLNSDVLQEMNIEQGEEMHIIPG